MTRYVVANRDWTGCVVEVFPVEELFDCKGQPTNDVGEAYSCVARDGSCHHAFDLATVPIFSVH